MSKSLIRKAVISLMVAIIGGIVANAVWKTHRAAWYWRTAAVRTARVNGRLVFLGPYVRRNSPDVRAGRAMAVKQTAIGGLWIIGTLGAGIVILRLAGEDSRTKEKGG